MKQEITLYDYEVQDVDAWEGRGTPLQIELDVFETIGTGSHGPTVSLAKDDGLSFAALGRGDGREDSSMSFVAGLDDVNAALSALTLHTTASDGAVAASGVLSLRACDTGEWRTTDGRVVGGQTGLWNWGNDCSDEGWAEQNITYSYRMGTMPVLERVWPTASPIDGGLTLEVR